MLDLGPWWCKEPVVLYSKCEPNVHLLCASITKTGPATILLLPVSLYGERDEGGRVSAVWQLWEIQLYQNQSYQRLLFKYVALFLFPYPKALSGHKCFSSMLCIFPLPSTGERLQ
jgi:hypothetical protein